MLKYIYTLIYCTFLYIHAHFCFNPTHFCFMLHHILHILFVYIFLHIYIYIYARLVRFCKFKLNVTFLYTISNLFRFYVLARINLTAPESN